MIECQLSSCQCSVSLPCSPLRANLRILTPTISLYNLFNSQAMSTALIEARIYI